MLYSRWCVEGLQSSDSQRIVTRGFFNLGYNLANYCRRSTLCQEACALEKQGEFVCV